MTIAEQYTSSRPARKHVAREMTPAEIASAISWMKSDARSTSRQIRLCFRSSGMNQRKPKPGLPWIANCPNALDLSVYPVKPHTGDYLLFVGRMSPDKGCHRAIAVATETGLPLKIAGKNREPAEQEYFAEFVEPHCLWAHLDVMAWNTESRPGRPEGGEAMGMRTLYRLLKERFED